MKSANQTVRKSQIVSENYIFKKFQNCEFTFLSENHNNSPIFGHKNSNSQFVNFSENWFLDSIWDFLTVCFTKCNLHFHYIHLRLIGLEVSALFNEAAANASNFRLGILPTTPSIILACSKSSSKLDKLKKYPSSNIWWSSNRWKIHELLMINPKNTNFPNHVIPDVFPSYF